MIWVLEEMKKWNGIYLFVFVYSLCLDKEFMSSEMVNNVLKWNGYYGILILYGIRLIIWIYLVDIGIEWNIVEKVFVYKIDDLFEVIYNCYDYFK